MRTVLICLIFLVKTLESYCQEDVFFSTEIDAGYYHYFLGEINANKFNYGFSFLLSENIHRLKVSTGINYSTKSFYKELSPQPSSNFLRRVDYEIKYLNFPIIGTYKVISKGLFSASVSTGFVFNKIIDFDIKEYYLYAKTFSENNIKDDLKLGISAILGVVLSRSVHKNFVLHLSPFVGMKIRLDHLDQRPRDMPNDRLSVGCKIGVEYLLRRNSSRVAR